MDTLLIVLTAISVAATAVMGVILIRVVRDDRRRSDARVELLSRLASIGERAEDRVATLGPRPVVTPVVAPPVISNVIDDFELRTASGDHAGPMSANELFHEHDQPSVWPRRLAVAGTIAALLTVTVGGARYFTSKRTPSGSAQAAPAVQPLELLTLDQTQADGTLTITGVVHNPQGSAALQGIQASVQVFDASGGLVTSGRAPLDFALLSPGEESPFVVRLPMAVSAARYRVSFRTADDRVLGHVDRRNIESAARRQAS